MKTNIQTPVRPMAERIEQQRATRNAVKIGPDYFPVATLQEAVDCWTAARDQNEWFSSNAPGCTACIGKRLYRISYNGRVWDAATRAEVAMPGRQDLRAE